MNDYRQETKARGMSRLSDQAGYLVIKAAPVGSESKIGMRLIDAGELPAGAYRCEIETYGWNTAFDVVLKPTNVSGGSFAPSVSTLLLDRTTAKATVAGANFATNTTQTIVSPASGALRGTVLAVVTFTVAAAQTIDFTGGLAEFHGR